MNKELKVPSFTMGCEGADYIPPMAQKSRMNWLRHNVYGTVLDIGCNRGELFNGTSQAAFAMGVDLDLWNPGYGLGFRQADAHFLPFKDGEFTTCVLAEILEHVINPVKVLQEARRVALGHVVISVPYEYNWDDSNRPCLSLDARMEKDKLTYEQLFIFETLAQPGCNGAIDDRTNPHLWHVRWYTFDDLCEQIEAAGMNYKIELLEYGGWSWFMGVLK